MDRPWNHGNLESSEGADTQTCDGADQNFDHNSEGDPESGVQLVDRPRHSIRIYQEGEVCKPCEGVQGRRTSVFGSLVLFKASTKWTLNIGENGYLEC